MAVIWGLNMKEIQWSKFKSSNMWNNRYHLRRTKFIVYQIAMIFCVVSESLGTAALSDYIDQQDYVEANLPGAHVHNNDFVGAGSYNIFVGVFVATIFGAAFFFDLFWPERYESPAVKLAWRICAVLAPIFALSSALTLTIIVATHRSYLTGLAVDQADRLAHEKQFAGSPLIYKQNGRAIASVVFLWPGWIATVASAIILWMSYDHNDKFGPKSTSVREAEEKAEIEEANLGDMKQQPISAQPDSISATEGTERNHHATQQLA